MELRTEQHSLVPAFGSHDIMVLYTLEFMTVSNVLRRVISGFTSRWDSRIDRSPRLACGLAALISAWTHACTARTDGDGRMDPGGDTGELSHEDAEAADVLVTYSTPRWCATDCLATSICAVEFSFARNSSFGHDFGVCSDIDTDLVACASELDSCQPLGVGCEDSFAALMRCRSSWLGHDSSEVVYGECLDPGPDEPHFVVHTAGERKFHVTCSSGACGCATSPDGPDWRPINSGIPELVATNCEFARVLYDYVITACRDDARQ